MKPIANIKINAKTKRLICFKAQGFHDPFAAEYKVRVPIRANNIIKAI